MARIALAAAAAVLVAGCGAQAEPGPRTYRDEARGFAIAVPDGWERADSSLTPGLVDPLELVSMGTGQLLPAPRGACGHVPSGALQALGTEDALVSIQERAGEPTPEFDPRAQPFELGPPSRTDVSGCVPQEETFSEWFLSFGAAGRGFYAIVAVGKDAPAELRREAESIVASFEAFGPGRRHEEATP